MSAAERIREATLRLAREAGRLRFHEPVRYVYNPLVYARGLHEKYIMKFAASRISVLFIGMNPGPWGMAQTGVPFGEIAFVRDWMGISGHPRPPVGNHPRVPVLGLDCTRSEVSGRRFWGLMKEMHGTARTFFKTGFVSNYCPLMFLDERGTNITPDRLSAPDRSALYKVCGMFLGSLVDALEPKWVIGIGKFAQKRAEEAAVSLGWKATRIGVIPHPSPANPAANADWAGIARRELESLGAFPKSTAHHPLSLM